MNILLKFLGSGHGSKRKLVAGAGSSPITWEDGDSNKFIRLESISADATGDHAGKSGKPGKAESITVAAH